MFPGEPSEAVRRERGGNGFRGKEASQTAAGSVGIDTDVNQSGKADVNDAQLVYDIYNRVYNDGYETVSMEKFLRADQNADGVLDSQDAVTLAGKLHV